MEDLVVKRTFPGRSFLWRKSAGILPRMNVLVLLCREKPDITIRTFHGNLQRTRLHLWWNQAGGLHKLTQSAQFKNHGHLQHAFRPLPQKGTCHDFLLEIHNNPRGDRESQRNKEQLVLLWHIAEQMVHSSADPPPFPIPSFHGQHPAEGEEKVYCLSRFTRRGYLFVRRDGWKFACFRPAFEIESKRRGIDNNWLDYGTGRSWASLFALHGLPLTCLYLHLRGQKHGWSNNWEQDKGSLQWYLPV